MNTISAMTVAFLAGLGCYHLGAGLILYSHYQKIASLSQANEMCKLALEQADKRETNACLLSRKTMHECLKESRNK